MCWWWFSVDSHRVDENQTRPTSPALQWAAVGTMWILLSAVVWLVRDELPWKWVFAATGFLWMWLPLVTTRLNARGLTWISAVTLAAATSLFLALFWVFTVMIGALAPLFTERAPPSGSEVAWALFLEAVPVIPAAVVGAILGLALRRGRPSVRSNLARAAESETR